MNGKWLCYNIQTTLFDLDYTRHHNNAICSKINYIYSCLHVTKCNGCFVYCVTFQGCDEQFSWNRIYILHNTSFKLLNGFQMSNNKNEGLLGPNQNGVSVSTIVKNAIHSHINHIFMFKSHTYICLIVLSHWSHYRQTQY